MDYRLRELLDEITFTLSVLDEQETIKNSWLDEQKIVLKNLMKEVSILDNESSSIDTNKKISKDTLETVNKSAKILFKVIEFRVKIDKKTLYKNYFSKNISVVERTKNGFLRAFENIEQKLNNESLDSLLLFKDKVSEILILLRDIDKNIVNLSSNKKFKKIDKDLQFNKLNSEYKRLKLTIQAICIGTKIKYKIFTLKKSNKKIKKESTES